MKREVADSLGLLLVVVGVSLVVVPIVNVGLTVYPFKPAQSSWRFGMWGFLLGAMTLPMLGIGMIGAGGGLKQSRAVVRFGMLAATILLVIVVGGLIDFRLGGATLRAVQKAPDAALLYTLELRKTTIISALTIPAFAALAFAQYRLLSDLTVATEGPQSILHVGKS